MCVSVGNQTRFSGIGENGSGNKAEFGRIGSDEQPTGCKVVVLRYRADG